MKISQCADVVNMPTSATPGFSRTATRMATTMKLFAASTILLLFIGASMARPNDSATKSTPLKKLLSMLDSARRETKLGQTTKPYANISLDAGTWGEWRDPQTGITAFTANNPRIMLSSDTGDLEIPVDAARYLIDRDRGLQSYVLTISGLSRHGCLTLKDVQTAFPQGKLIMEINHPPHGILPPDERWNVEWRVGGAAGTIDILSFWFDFQEEPSLVTPTCVRRITLGLSK